MRAQLTLALVALSTLSSVGWMAGWPSESSTSSEARSPARTEAERPGAFVVFDGPDGAAASARTSRLVALHVPVGTPPALGLAPGPFTARFRGVLRMSSRDRVVFGLEGTGKVTFRIGGEAVLEGELAEGQPLVASGRRRLDPGDHPFSLEWRDDSARRDARLRLLWTGRDFPREPVPPRVLFHEAPNDAEARGVALHRGRALFTAHRCTACHGEAPESAGAPALAGIGHRLTPAWMAAWLADPASHRPAARMPDLFSDGEEDAGRIRDLVAWLAARREGVAPTEFAPPEGAVREGGLLFHERGCIGCHTRPDVSPATADADGRHPLSGVAAKYRSGALRDFLMEPARHHPGIRMPDFAFSTAEATALAAYLRGTAIEDSRVVASKLTGNAKRGSSLASELGCVACHEPRMAGAAQVEPVAAMDHTSGCLSTAPGARAPDFRFRPGERSALVIYLAHRAGEHPDSPSIAEEGLGLVGALRCTACHALDRDPDLWSRLQPETADLLPDGHEAPHMAQVRPQLTWAGEKLEREWAAEFISEGAARPLREWLRARMPAFPGRGAAIAAGLAAAHGLPPDDPAAGPPDPKAVEAGGWLASPEAFGCGACHAIGDRPAYAQFEFGAVNLDRSAERLRADFFTRWMRDPRRVDPANRMPLYADEEGYTRFDEILDGRAEAQFTAIWEWMRTL